MPEDEVVTRTVRASIRNHRQVQDDLDRHGFAASKLWNVGLWTIHRVWNETGDHIPDNGELSKYLKTHERYRDLPAQSSQRVLQELSEAFHSWYQQENSDHNPPGYRKRGDSHPRSTVTWKNSGFRVDSKHQQIRLAKGRNHKDSRYARDYILCEYETRPDVDLEEVTSVQQVRAVWNGEKWELHIVYRTRIDAPEQPGERTAGVDLGITNFAAISIGEETLLYPGNALKEDAHHFRQHEYETEGEDGPSREAERLRRKKARRQRHFLHAVTRDIVDELVRRNVGEVAIGHPRHIRDDSDWGRHGNKRLHDWPFARALDSLEYKAEERGIEVERVDEARLNTSKTCCCCGEESDGNRVERGLYACEECGLTANADVNAAENMRLTVTPSLAPGDRGWDRRNGCLAQPAVRLFDKSTGRVAGREQVVCEP
jgi:putative transposase